ncbi:UDP-N-acetylenolpyruvoylglucosamine reductase [Clostridium formicaceticum]|uniref:UDP-N-acetylenolpyruvoylglucosamine reductase n=1 Tax=Clostridium formicaceticum TaxID=1497 RepID=A0AAC9WJ53_9CLOT|nr:UDP-N-acetylmuramate dehydrogenase [Clostridium formicaceticum]AOY74784.1 UDP-N-acetylenolpyruvoylglucosamine reductase [Clostridium formicaceticum]ARE89175.1 UDP-N-acetylenolpyruvoylglucosamine reductase [Clostridium formicaceticum]
MDKNKLYQQFLTFMTKENVLLDEPMKKHTSFKIGGPADILLTPQSIDEIQRAIEVCKAEGVAYFVMGNGSNLLIRDKGIRKVVIKIAEKFNHVVIAEEKVTAQAGILLSTLSKRVLQKNLKGFEFASGIPGTLGGAVTMNAGAYGGEMKDVIKHCKVLNEEGEILDLPCEVLQLGYRTSIIQKKNYIVLEVTVQLEKGQYDEIKAVIDDLTEKRTTKQPLHFPSAGSTFKRPQGYFAGKLIQDAGLKGARVGDAQVSELHSGFIVNVGDATAEDVLNLIALVQKNVLEKFDVVLEPEVRIVGEE